MTTAPNVKKQSATMIMILRPYLSERGPATMEPMAAPKVVKETIVYKKEDVRIFFKILPLYGIIKFIFIKVIIGLVETY